MRFRTTISREIEVEVSCSFHGPEPDVGIFHGWIEDLEIKAVGGGDLHPALTADEIKAIEEEAGDRAAEEDAEPPRGYDRAKEWEAA